MRPQLVCGLTLASRDFETLESETAVLLFKQEELGQDGMVSYCLKEEVTMHLDKFIDCRNCFETIRGRPFKEFFCNSVCESEYQKQELDRISNQSTIVKAVTTKTKKRTWIKREDFLKIVEKEKAYFKKLRSTKGVPFP